MNKSATYRGRGKKLIVTGLSRPETVAAYKSADLFFFTSNIECSPIVLFECMASKTPFLTTDVGNAKEIVGWSGSGIVLPTCRSAYLERSVMTLLHEILVATKVRQQPSLPDLTFSKARIKESISILEDIYRQPEKRRQMAEAGFKVWQERFTWEKIARDYETLYDGLVSGKK